jgi:MFS family permease
MQNVPPVINEARRSGRRQLAFISAVVSLVASFAVAAAPIPLYNIYRAEDAFTNAGISMAVATYSAGAIVGLLVLGRLSNYPGRRPTAIASLGLLLLGCLLLLNVHDIDILLADRLLVGVGTGLASSSLTSYIVDAAPSRPEWLASVASSQGPMLGLTVGAIASGALVQFGPWPRDLIYLVSPASYYCLRCSSPSARKPRLRCRALGDHCFPGSAYRPGSGICSLSRRRCSWPPGNWRLLPSVCPCAGRRPTPHPQPVHPRICVRRLYGPSVLGAPIGGRFTSAVAQRVGMVTFLAGIIGIITAINTGTLALFIIATIVAGAGQGIGISAATRGLLQGSTLADRAPIFSAI